MKPPQPAGSDDQALTVSQISEKIRATLAQRFGTTLRVVGEVSNHTDRGHWYWTLKDEQNVIGCVMWRSAAERCKHQLADGQQVLVTGKLDYYGPQGRLQLYADRIEPVGTGALELRFKQLCQKLREAGYFDPEHKIQPPHIPKHIAVITSAEGAAWHDVRRTARNRWPGVRLSLVDVRVQGEAAAPQIVAAIKAVEKQHAQRGIDTILLTRGGGSLEDLWAFNEPVVAKAIHQCKIPLVAAIGHESDLTIAELVADVRCSTPTQAAAFLIPDMEAERQRIAQWLHRLSTSIRRTVEHHRLAIESLGQRLPAACLTRVQQNRIQLNGFETALARIEPATRLNMAKMQLDQGAQRLRAIHRQTMARRTASLDAAEKQLQAMGPPSVLRRGYTYTTDAKGKPIRSTQHVRDRQSIVTHLHDGTVQSTVEKPGPSKPAKPTPDQLNLFGLPEGRP